MFWNGVPECSVTEYHVMILRHRTLWDSIPEHPLPGTPFQNILYLGLRSRTRTVIKGHALPHLPLTYVHSTQTFRVKSGVRLRILGVAPKVDEKGVALKVGEKVAPHLTPL